MRKDNTTLTKPCSILKHTNYHQLNTLKHAVYDNVTGNGSSDANKTNTWKQKELMS